MHSIGQTKNSIFGDFGGRKPTFVKETLVKVGVMVGTWDYLLTWDKLAWWWGPGTTSLPETLVHPVSKTHWATRRRQPSLLTASCCTTSHVTPMLFKSCCMVFIEFFRGLPGFLFQLLKSQCTACLGSLHSHNVPEPSQSSLFYPS